MMRLLGKLVFLIIPRHSSSFLIIYEGRAWHFSSFGGAPLWLFSSSHPEDHHRAPASEGKGNPSLPPARRRAEGISNRASHVQTARPKRTSTPAAGPIRVMAHD
jgi:hypothetical protein